MRKRGSARKGGERKQAALSWGRATRSGAGRGFVLQCIAGIDAERQKAGEWFAKRPQ